jgi:hypothetical protein
MNQSTCFSAGATRGADNARQIKITSTTKSPHVHVSKPASSPVRARGRLNVLCSYGRDPKSRQGSSNFNRKTSSGIKRTPPSQETIKIVVREYAVPAIGVFALATILGPIIGAVALSAFGLALAIASTVAFFSLSWIFIPVILSFMGLPLLLGGGLATSLFAGAAGVLLFPTLLNIGLITAAAYLGISVARSYFYPDDNVESDVEYTGTIDVEAETLDLDDTLEREMEMEAKRREQELKEFDELLKRREKFQRGGR